MRSEDTCHNGEEGAAHLSKDEDEGHGGCVDLSREEQGADRETLGGVSSGFRVLC